MIRICLSILLVGCLCCKSNPTSTGQAQSQAGSVVIENNEPKTTESTHLMDTIFPSGSFILFLLPDSLRFESLENEWVYDVDADFAVGISNTIDSIVSNNEYSAIKAYTTDKRYISVNDCNECPVIIDRDTVNYGVILSSQGEKIKTIYNEVHSGDYLEEIRAFFELTKK